MKVTLLYFAAARERAGVPRETVELGSGATAADARDAACAAHPGLRAIVDRLRLAVDQEFAGAEKVLRDGSEVAFIPPVSGGAGAHRISDGPLSIEAPAAAVMGNDCGAVVSFVGTVRATNRGRSVVRLEYEAYPEMALRVFARIEEEARTRWPGTRLAIHHRIGSLDPGAVSVVIAAASPHRADAFSASRHAIEELKKDAPIWKREHYQDGSEWVGLGS
ncbi:MAG TPA: molybdopterin converting factor subunit 1 [Myxococcales bacterium]|jgi:molybdopterin synthase catalytic subunit|nr:molybdopterin converting factor subunit 1 [Myxococcales bacterium]